MLHNFCALTLFYESMLCVFNKNYRSRLGLRHNKRLSLEQEVN